MNERKIKWLGIVCGFLVTAVNGWIFEGGQIGIILFRLFFVFAGGIVQWEGAHYVVRLGRRRYPLLEQARLRVLFTAGCCFGIALFLALAGDYLLDHLVEGKPYALTTGRILSVAAGALYFALVSLALFESVYYFSNYHKTELEKQELLRSNLQSQFDSLKSQVNPHFLFNSLNSLSYLIRKDARRAEQFVEELSTVYRYLLKSNERELHTLREELKFIESYSYLLKTRFGDNLQVILEVAEEHLPAQIPPLSLQLLVENAVKHNIISHAQQLHIRISTTEAGSLQVVNRLQKKTREVFSEKKGLANIQTKYRLLGQPGLDIQETGTEFIVTLPLIKPQPHESIHH